MLPYGIEAEAAPTVSFPATPLPTKPMRPNLWTIIAALLLTACSGPQWLRSPPPVETDDLTAFHQAWNAYADDVNTIERQRDCQPRLIPAAGAHERRGAVIMFHGLSGCPQQYFALAARVAAHGYDVLLPLHPGHGLPPDENGKDDISRLPQADDEQNDYAEFAVRMNDIMAQSPGEKIIVGFSLGGAISLNASLNAPGLYDRQLLFSPMFSIRGGAFIEGLVAVLGRTPGVRNLVVKPGGARKICAGWQAAGRAGFCEYQLKDAISLLQIEDINDALYAEQPPTMPIQVITAGDEKYVSNPRIAELVEIQREYGPVSMCTLPDDVPHEMLSPYENRERQMYWLGGLLAGAIEFIVDGQFFAVEAEEDGLQTSTPACRLNQQQERL